MLLLQRKEKESGESPSNSLLPPSLLYFNALLLIVLRTERFSLTLNSFLFLPDFIKKTRPACPSKKTRQSMMKERYGRSATRTDRGRVCLTALVGDLSLPPIARTFFFVTGGPRTCRGDLGSHLQRFFVLLNKVALFFLLALPLCVFTAGSWLDVYRFPSMSSSARRVTASRVEKLGAPPAVVVRVAGGGSSV